MTTTLYDILKNNPVEASAPCRVDMGGTLDLRTFHFPLNHLKPCTFNIALDLRTRIEVTAYKKGRVRISSKGFKTAEFLSDKLPFDHPLGFMFAVAAYFGADGTHIHIDSSSPARSALGGSSVAAVALIKAISKARVQAGESPLSRIQIAVLAQAIEETVAGVPCGFQDQLAAAFGGVNAWYWTGKTSGPAFKRKVILGKKESKELNDHILVAYCGIPHESSNINGQWVRQFLAGKYRKEWADIIMYTKKFIDSLAQHNYNQASEFMRRETAVRTRMTPGVLDDMGKKLVRSAGKLGCGARFTGAGGGGCVWAVGEKDTIKRLMPVWQELLLKQKHASLLNTCIDPKGVC